MSDVDANQNVSDAQVSDATASAQVGTTGEAAAPPGDEAPATAGDEEQGKAPGTKKPVSERFSEITAKRRDAERRAEVAESLADRLMKALAEGRVIQPNGDSKPATDAEPKQADYRTYEDYLDARAEFRAERKFNELVEKSRGEVSKQSQEQGQQERWSGFTAALDEQGEQIEGFEEAAEAVFSDPKFPVSQAMADYLMDAADHKAPMVKWLAENRTDAARIYKLSPAAAAKELAKVDAQLGATPPPNTTKAPPPAPRVAGRGSAPASIETMSWEDTKKWAAKQSRS